jgi:Domain of Unknown Function (DUF928)
MSKFSLVPLCVFVLLLIPIATLAAPKYRQPQSIQTDAGNRSGSLQGCAQDLALPLTLLVPTHIAQTVSARPALFWYLASPKDIRIRFYELSDRGVPQELWQQTVQVEQAGIAQLPYPAAQPELAIGKTYAWSAALVCDDDNPAIAPIGPVKFQRVESSQWLQTELTKAKTDQRRAELYAISGQWYDSIDARAKALVAGPTHKNHRQNMLLLLDQIGLKSISDRER